MTGDDINVNAGLTIGDTVEITADAVEQRLARLVVEHGERLTPAELAYRRAAAVLVSFVPGDLRPVGAPPDEQALAALLRVSEPVYAPSGRLEWRLTDVLRRETLADFHDEAALRQAVGANPIETGGPVERMLSAYLTKSAPPLEYQSYEDLLGTAQVTAWLQGIVRGIPNPQTVQDRLAVAEMLAPLRRLVGTSFRGRADVLERLHDYAGILPPGSRLQAARRRVRRFFSLGDHPPLVLYGPGGVGKSTVLAKFLLDHVDVEPEDRIPFVYIDFDRPGILGQEPLTLLVDALRQLGLEYPAVRADAEQLRQTWLERLAQPDFGLLASAVLDPPTQLAERPSDVPEAIALRAGMKARGPFFEEFAELAAGISTNRPILLVLDTFETVQHYGADTVHEVWEFLDNLQRQLPSLRVVIAGRAPLESHATQPVRLAGFDEASARAFLASLLGPELAADSELIDHTIHSVGRNPLNLRLAADLVSNHGPHELDDITSRRVLQVRVRAEQVQGWLYQRILDRITDPNVRALAHPGLVVRRLTPDVIRHVLAGPCGVDVPDDGRARVLFDACAREVSLLSWNTDGSLEHRADIRREMLPLLRRSAPEKVAEIHAAAIDYYQEHEDITSRAEELYHRLSLGEAASSLDARWERGAENLLSHSLDELPAESRVYLAARLGITLAPEVLDKARLQEQERYTATRVRQLIKYGELDTALSIVRKQKVRGHDSPLDLLEAQILEELGRLQDASDVLDSASERAARAADGRSLAQLQYAAARLAERQGRPDAALELVTAAWRTMPAGTDPLMPLRVATAELRIRRSAPRARKPARPAERGIEAARHRVLNLVDSLPEEQVTEDSVLLAELVGEIGEMRPHLVTRALLLIGLPDLRPAQVEELAAALAGWDAEKDHEPAIRLHLPQGAESDAPAWAGWLRETAPRAVTRGIVEVLTRYDGGEGVVAVVAGLYRDSLARASMPPNRHQQN